MTVFHGILESLDRSEGSDVTSLISSKSFNIYEFSNKEKQW